MNRINMDILLKNTYIRSLYWIILFICTGLMLVFPVELKEIYHTIQAPYIFSDLYLFSAIYLIWIICLTLLIFSSSIARYPMMENLFTVVIFSLVFCGYWIIITPNIGYTDGLYNLALVKQLITTGNIPRDNMVLWYFDFPGLHIIGCVLCIICSFNILLMGNVFAIINICVFSSILFLLYSNLFKKSAIAAFACVLSIMSNTFLADMLRLYYPHIIGLSLYLVFLFVLIKLSIVEKEPRKLAYTFLLILTLVGLTISYFSVPVIIVITLLLLYLARLLNSTKTTSPYLVILSAILLLSWEALYTTYIFGSLVSFLPKIWDDINSGKQFSALFLIGLANAGERVPVWANIVRWAWWLMVYAFGSLIMLYNLRHISKLDAKGLIVNLSLLGVIVLTILGVFGTRGGEQFARFIKYGTLFCVPILLLFIMSLRPRFKVAIPVLVAVLILLSLPSFLTVVNTIESDTYYSYDHRAGEFMELNYQSGTNLTGFHVGLSLVALGPYYIPKATLVRTIEVWGLSEEALWLRINDLLDQYELSKSVSNTKTIFVMNGKSIFLIEHLMGITSDNPKWQEIFYRLNQSNLVYNNGFDDIFMAF